jgi:hypothetical protein
MTRLCMVEYLSLETEFVKGKIIMSSADRIQRSTSPLQCSLMWHFLRAHEFKSTAAGRHP